MLSRFTKAYHEFPPKFWILVLARFIDALGGTLIWPFFALYVTDKFKAGMTDVGVLFAIFSISSLLGNMIGGGLTDKFGRKGIVLFGLIFSALSAIAMGFAGSLSTFYAVASLVGLVSDMGGPANQAMVADILPEEQRAEGFGMLRVSHNLSWVIGPTVGGILATRSYLALFVLDAVCTLITALIVYRHLPETRPTASVEQKGQSVLETFAGYRHVLADKIFVAFLAISVLMIMVYQQLYTTLSVYLRDMHGITAQGFGLMVTVNALTVVLLQFWVTRRLKPHPPMLLMMAGSLLYMVGFAMYGFVSAYALFVLAVVVITLGEMIVVPVSQALVAQLAPEDLRGRYMGLSGLAWTIPATVGPWAAGIVMDNYNPNWVWYAGGIICAVAAFGFLRLHLITRSRLASITTEAADAI